jgi:hypothetical protein
MVAGHAISRPRIHLTRMDLTDHQGQLQPESAVHQVRELVFLLETSERPAPYLPVLRIRKKYFSDSDPKSFFRIRIRIRILHKWER